MIIRNNIKELSSIHSASYCFLKQICLEREVAPEGMTSYQVKIVLSRILGNEMDDMTIICGGAFNIKIGDINGMFGMLLDIEDIKLHQIEGAAYRVTEQENNAFSLLCNEFQVELANLNI